MIGTLHDLYGEAFFVCFYPSFKKKILAMGLKINIILYKILVEQI